MDYGGGTIGGFEGRRQDSCSGCFGLGQSRVQIGHLVSGGFIAKRIGEVAVGDVDLHISEQRRDADAAIDQAGAADFTGIGVAVIGNDLAAGEGDEVAHEVIGAVDREIDAVVGNGLERRVGRGLKCQ